MARHLKELERENTRLKKLVADQALDMLILKEAVRPNGLTPSVVVGPLMRCVVAWGLTGRQNVARAERCSSRAARSGISPSVHCWIGH